MSEHTLSGVAWLDDRRAIPALVDGQLPPWWVRLWWQVGYVRHIYLPTIVCWLRGHRLEQDRIGWACVRCGFEFFPRVFVVTTNKSREAV